MKYITLQLFILFQVYSQVQIFEKFKEEMENKVLNISDKMKKLYSQRCSSDTINCSTKSYHLCFNTASRSCFQNFPTFDECISDGIIVSQESGVIYPTDNIDSLSNTQKQFVCTSAQLQQTFRRNQQRNQQSFTFQYFGSQTGVFRLYPGMMEQILFEGSQCYQYDPRSRPWYASAIAGSKNIIILVDTSSSMENSLQDMKQALNTTIQTMSIHDHVGIITFSDQQAVVLGGYNKIQRAREKVRKQLKQSVKSIKTSGEGNYQVGLEKAFDIINEAVEDQLGAQCKETIFLFMSNGKPTKGIKTFQQISGLIEEGLSNITSKINLKFMSYIVSTNNDDEVLMQVSCKYNGILLYLNNDELSRYYKYIAEGSTVLQPIWTQPYDDAFKLGRIVTVTMPVYYENENSEIREILGVAAIDVTMTKLNELNITEEDVFLKLIKQAYCFKSNLTQCNLQMIRQKKCNISCQNNTQNAQIPLCSRQINSEIHQTSIYTTQDENQCCSLTKSQLGILLGSLLGGIFIIAIIIIIKTKLFPPSPPPKQQVQVDRPPDSNAKIIISHDSDHSEEEVQEEEEYYRKAREAGLKVYEFQKFP